MQILANNDVKGVVGVMTTNDDGAVCVRLMRIDDSQVEVRVYLDDVLVLGTPQNGPDQTDEDLEVWQADLLEEHFDESH